MAIPAMTWKKVKARVARRCIGYTRSSSCGKLILKDDYFLKCNWRNGLEHAEICLECAIKNNIHHTP